MRPAKYVESAINALWVGKWQAAQRTQISCGTLHLHLHMSLSPTCQARISVRKRADSVSLAIGLNRSGKSTEGSPAECLHHQRWLHFVTTNPVRETNERATHMDPESEYGYQSEVTADGTISANY